MREREREEKDSHAEREGGVKTSGIVKHTGRKQHGCNRAGTREPPDNFGRSKEPPVHTGLKLVVKHMSGGMDLYFM